MPQIKILWEGRAHNKRVMLSATAHMDHLPRVGENVRINITPATTVPVESVTHPLGLPTEITLESHGLEGPVLSRKDLDNLRMMGWSVEYR